MLYSNRSVFYKILKIDWCKNYCQQSADCLGFVYTAEWIAGPASGYCWFKNSPNGENGTFDLTVDAPKTSFAKASDCPPPTTTTTTATTTTTKTTTPLPSNAGKLIQSRLSDCLLHRIDLLYILACSTTISGIVCQYWNSTEPHNPSDEFGLPEPSDNNLCSNPDNSANGDWCYTTDPEVRWEYCDCASQATVTSSPMLTQGLFLYKLIALQETLQPAICRRHGASRLSNTLTARVRNIPRK